MFSVYYGFWDYWKLYHKVTFDGVNKLIIINEGVTQIDGQRDIYSSWKEWVLLSDNAKFLQAINTVGGEPTVAGQRLDVTYFLINGWKLKPQPGSYTLNIIGNLFDIDGGAIFIPADVDSRFPNNINISTNTSVIVRQVQSQAIEGGLTEEQNTALFNIEDRVIAIENRFNQPITATLESSQSEVLNDIQLKLSELWKIHGLDGDNPVAVSKQGRLVDDISQIFVETEGVVTVSRG
jgi:hypothetical protein